MKKNIFLLVAILGIATNLFAQRFANTFQRNLPEILIAGDLTLHFVSPEPIRYVDISSRAIAGDLPVSNVLRVKVIPDSLKLLSALNKGTIVTIVGESFIAQYQLRLASAQSAPDICTQVNISQQHMQPIDVSGVSMTTPELKTTALAMLAERPARDIRKVQDYGIQMKLNHLYTAGDLIFLDLSCVNRTKLPFDTDQLRFKIEDNRITKATNVQSVELQPMWQLYPEAGFKICRRNIYVLKKVTFPENKVLNIALTEKQISGRSLTLKIPYRDILNADTF
jgi:conjugative transposon TraN protein